MNVHHISEAVARSQFMCKEVVVVAHIVVRIWAEQLTNANQSTNQLPGLYHDAKTKDSVILILSLLIYGPFTDTVSNYTGWCKRWHLKKRTVKWPITDFHKTVCCCQWRPTTVIRKWQTCEMAKSNAGATHVRVLKWQVMYDDIS
jgi:hypothetical protein